MLVDIEEFTPVTDFVQYDFYYIFWVMFPLLKPNRGEGLVDTTVWRHHQQDLERATRQSMQRLRKVCVSRQQADRGVGQLPPRRVGF